MRQESVVERLRCLLGIYTGLCDRDGLWEAMCELAVL